MDGRPNRRKKAAFLHFSAVADLICSYLSMNKTHNKKTSELYPIQYIYLIRRFGV